MNNKILIFGKGFIGNRLQEELSSPCSTARLKTSQDIQHEIDRYKPQMIINCIGQTGKNNVDDCEKVVDQTLEANTFIPLLMAEVALRNHIKLVHVSSGCIYHYDYTKSRPISEEKIPDYYDLYYSRTKIYADSALRELAKRYDILIIRIRIPLDDRPHPKNLLTKLINYKTIIDVPNSTTYIPDFIRALKYLLHQKAKGTYNVVAKGALVYSKLLDVYQKYRPDFEYKIISLKDLKLVRTNLILSTRKLEKLGFPIRHSTEILEECVKNYIKYL